MTHALGPSGMGTVVLDVGGDIGALVIHTGQADLGREIEVSPVDGGPRTHAAVRRRDLRDGSVFSAVYPGLPAGRYVIWHDEDTPRGEIDVYGAAVTECVWAPSLEYRDDERPAAAAPPARTPPPRAESPQSEGSPACLGYSCPTSRWMLPL